MTNDQRRALEAVTAFSLAVGRIEADLTLSASEKAQGIFRELASALNGLEHAGPISRQQAEARLERLAQTAADSLSDYHAEIGAALGELFAGYPPSASGAVSSRRAADMTHLPPVTTGEKLRSWWDRGFVLTKRSTSVACSGLGSGTT